MPWTRKHFACVALAVVFGLGFQAQAQEWTRFRGPNGTGISEAKTIPTTFTEQDFNWKVKLPAEGHSSPVLWGEKIFLTCADDGATAERLVVCLNAKNGGILWSKNYASSFHKKHPHNSFASSTPAVDEERVYCVWSTPEEYTLLALDHDGNKVWQRALGPFVSQHSCGVSPIVYGEMVVLANDQDAEGGGKSFLIAVDRRTGTPRWQIDRTSDLVAYSTPCVYQPEGEKPQLIFSSKAHGMTAVNPEDGTIVWELSRTADGKLLDKRSVSSPVLARGLLTISCGQGNGGNYLLTIRPPDARTGAPAEPVYRVEQKAAAPYVPTPLAKDDLLFLWNDGGIVSCLEAATGKVHWLKRIETGGNFFGSPVWVDGRLFCVAKDGNVVVLAASREYELLATNPLGEMCHTTPAIADGRMYIRTYNHLISIGGKKN
ncbi:MAG: PQQ-binding-like beta-propeller repeat protein [Planctomycetia bacterium]|nr:PQQ-binding-like beta-propeller repeat protein [Planctomycetia bacterium]